jgi:molybdopterin-guanine dinucleotide biosynthesis protein A
MGVGKALLQFEGETLAERALRKLREVSPEVAIAGGSPALSRFGRVIVDETPGCGPLGGIVSALAQSALEWNLFIPVDTPFLPVAALRMLLFGAGGGALGYLAMVGGEVQPLCAVISRQALPILRVELLAGRLGVRKAIESNCKVAHVVFHDKDWFRNLNTPEEFESAAGRAGSLPTQSSR